MKLAIVQHYLCGIVGSERIFPYLCKEFPEANTYMFAHNSAKKFPYFRNRGIGTTWLNRRLQSIAACRWSFSLSTYLMHPLDPLLRSRPNETICLLGAS